MPKLLRAGIVLLCFALLLPTALPVVADEAAVPPVYIVSTAVYYSPSPFARVIGYLENRKMITVLGQTGNYYCVDCYDCQGYVSQSQVTVGEDGQYYVNCQEGAPDTRVAEQMPRSQADTIRQAILELGETCIGTPYVMGGTSRRGFDCCGLTQYLYNNNGCPIHRVVCDQLGDGYVVSKEEMQVGDLIFFNIAGKFAAHVGVYAGNGQVLHASTHGVMLSDLNSTYYENYFYCARRVLNAPDTGICATPVTGAVTAASYSGCQ